MKQSDKKKNYDRLYVKNNMKQIPLKMQLSDYEKLSDYCNAHSVPVATFIKSAIREKMERDD